jgi:hypothetical protein
MNVVSNTVVRSAKRELTYNQSRARFNAIEQRSNRQSTAVSAVVIPNAKSSKGTSSRFWTKHNRSQEQLVAACMPKVAAAGAGGGDKPKHHFKSKSAKAPKRQRVITSGKDLPLALISNDSMILKGIDQLDWAITHAKAPKPAGIAAVETIRAEIKKSCGFYMPVPVENIEVSSGVDKSLPFFSDGHGLLCASGTTGYAVFRGDLCKKVCRVSCSDAGRADGTEQGFMPLTQFLSALSNANKIAPGLAN